jgi:hypothetical protein
VANSEEDAMNRKLAAVIILAFLAVAGTRLLLPSPVSEEMSGLPADFATMTREEQVQVCAGCHRTQYEAEMDGPHANAYIKLVEHLNKEASAHHPEFYALFLDVVGEKYCVSCHASENLFEESLNLSLADIQDKFRESNTANRPSPRSGEESRLGGVDCLTCHFDGKGVVAGEHFTPGGGSGSGRSCQPRPSAVLSSDYSCAPCHSVNKARDESFYFSGAPNDLSCISCHVEHDQTGRSTHYYYWRHDNRERPKTAVISNFYRPRSIEHLNGILTIDVNTSLLPHRLSECPESVIRYEVCDNDGHIVASNEMRLNMRKEHRRQTVEIFQGNTMAGEDGFAPDGFSDTTIVIVIPNSKLNTPLSLRVVGISKPHYWIPDTLGIEVYHETFDLN